MGSFYYIELCCCYFLALLIIGSTHSVCMQDSLEGRTQWRDLCIQLCVGPFFLHSIIYTRNNEYRLYNNDNDVYNKTLAMLFQIDI